MATKTLIVLTDDLDGTTASETISFSYAGTDYEIDLNAEHASALRTSLGPYVEAARRRTSKGRPAPKSGPSAKLVRAWAAEQGMDVNPVGRLSQTVTDAYTAAN